MHAVSRPKVNMSFLSNYKFVSDFDVYNYVGQLDTLRQLLVEYTGEYSNFNDTWAIHDDKLYSNDENLILILKLGVQGSLR